MFFNDINFSKMRKYFEMCLNAIYLAFSAICMLVLCKLSVTFESLGIFLNVFLAPS